MMLGQSLIIPTVKLEVKELYEAQGFFAADINKNKANWLQFNMPVNGKTCFPKPDVIAEREERIRLIQKAINDSLEIKPMKERVIPSLSKRKSLKLFHPEGGSFG